MVNRPQKRQKMSVVFAEPNAALRQKIRATFSENGWDGIVFDLLEARDGEEAFHLFETQHPDLIVISTELHDLPGRIFCQRIRENEQERHTGIVVVAPHSKDQGPLSVGYLESGADDFVEMDRPSCEFKARLRSVLRMKCMTDELRSANHQLRLLTVTDDLTGLANMRGFNERFMEVLKCCRDGGCGLGVIMVDLDNFKTVNDSVNHLMGSFVLSEIGRIIHISGILGAGDFAARFGGDEFVMFCPAEDLTAVSVKAEELRKVIDQTRFYKDGQTVHITASFGVAWTPTGYAGKAEDLIKAADFMLYQSKQKGRNQVNSMYFSGEIDIERFPENVHYDELKVIRKGRVA